MAEISLSEYNERPKTEPRRSIISSRTGLLVAAVVVVVGASFFAGIQYQRGKTSVTPAVQTTSSQNGGPSGFGGFRRGDRALGTVSSVSNSSITIQTRSGATKTYTITSSTTVNNNGQTGSVSDIQSGDTVILTLDSLNTQTVSSIVLNPSFGGGGFGGGPNAPSSDGSGSMTNTTGA